MLKLLSPLTINKSPYRQRLADAGVKGGWNYALDHAWLFEHIDRYVREASTKFPVIFDVGCGNSMLHPFLEKELNVGIIGIDRIEGLCPHTQRTDIMDFCVDFLEFAENYPQSADIVFWLSSIEHNDMENQKRCVDASMKVLKPGGLFLATFGYAPETKWFEPSEQLNLSSEDAEWVMGAKWSSEPAFESTVAEYRLDLMDLDTRHQQRYGCSEYEFVVAAASLSNDAVR